MAHVFVLQGDLTTFECDAFLIPTGRNLWVRESWWNLREAELREAGAVKTGEVCTRPLAPEEQGLRPLPRRDTPWAWLGWTAGRGLTLEESVQRTLEFIDRVQGHPDLSRPSRPPRQKKLIGVPIVGTRHGGGAEVAGDLTLALVQGCLKKAREYDLDIALVAYGETDFSGAQAARRQLDGAWNVWSELPENLKTEADLLAQEALGDNLVVFTGAGMSLGAGIPTWQNLLRSLFQKLQVTPEEQVQIERWSVLDQAQYLARICGSLEPP